MPQSRYSNFLITALAIVLCSPVANASEIDVAAIQARAAKIKEVKDLLNNPDASIRLAAMDAMFASDDLALREAAFYAGMNSADESLRSLAVRHRFAEKSVLSLEMVLPDEPSEEQKALYQYYGGSLKLEPNAFDLTTGQFSFQSSYIRASSSGLKLDFSVRYGTGSLTMNDELIFTGVYSHKGDKNLSTAIPIKFSLQ